MSARTFPNWQELYREQKVESMPWYYPALDPDLENALTKQGLTRGRALDLGTGPGTQALELARRGFQVTGSDLSQAAIDKAAARGTEEQLNVTFVQDDVLASRLGEPFDFVFDRGCFHVFDPEYRTRYATTLAALVKPGGYLFLKCFSELQGGDFGPYRLSPQEIADVFTSAFEVVNVDRTVYQGVMDPLPQALFCTLQRRTSSAAVS